MHNRSSVLTPNALKAGILAKDRGALARAITLVESQRAEDALQADRLLETLWPHTGMSFRVGITGPAGVGKSTFIEALGSHVLETADQRLAVLAIDPSSEASKGSILGDRTRMHTLSRHPRAFIRASAAGSMSGGTASDTREAISLCEAAGYPRVFVETVGVGQQEILVKDMVDVCVVLVLAGAGDELQGIKRGILEMADLLIVHKADGDHEKYAQQAAAQYKNTLGFFSPRVPGWSVPVHLCSSLQGTGIAAVWESLLRMHTHIHQQGWAQTQRKAQEQRWMQRYVEMFLFEHIHEHKALREALKVYEKMVAERKSPPRTVARKFMNAYIKRQGITKTAKTL